MVQQTSCLSKRPYYNLVTYALLITIFLGVVSNVYNITQLNKSFDNTQLEYIQSKTFRVTMVVQNMIINLSLLFIYFFITQRI